METTVGPCHLPMSHASSMRFGDSMPMYILGSVELFVFDLSSYYKV